MPAAAALRRTAFFVALATFNASGLAQPQRAPATYEPSVGQEGKDVVWVPTPQAVVDKMLDMAKVTPKDQVDDMVLRGHLGHVEHLVDHGLRGRHPDDVLAFLPDRGLVGRRRPLRLRQARGVEGGESDEKGGAAKGGCCGHSRVSCGSVLDYDRALLPHIGAAFETPARLVEEPGDDRDVAARNPGFLRRLVGVARAEHGILVDR